MKVFFAVLLLTTLAWGGSSKTGIFQEEVIEVSDEGINFDEWETDFSQSMRRAKRAVEKCEKRSRNCRFEKYQALDLSNDFAQ